MLKSNKQQATSNKQQATRVIRNVGLGFLASFGLITTTNASQNLLPDSNWYPLASANYNGSQFTIFGNSDNAIGTKAF